MIHATPSAIEFAHASFTYASGHDGGGVHDINLTIRPGEVVLLCGGSGCGKTTLTRLINGLVPHYYDGELTGTVTVADKDISQCELYDLSGEVGSVFQNPRSQFFTVNTTNELAFCSENRGIPENEITHRIEKTADEMKITDLLDRSLFKLSGGQKQQIACASVSVADPNILVLDEPSSNLDMPATLRLADLIRIWKSKGKTVVVAEHRLHYLKDLIDTVVLMDKGRIVRVCGRNEVVDLPESALAQKGLRTFNLDSLTPKNPPNVIPLTVPAAQPSKEDQLVEPHLLIEDMSFAYRGCPACLSIDQARVPSQAVVACIGHNGAGKSTFARCLCGLERKARGTLGYRTGISDESALKSFKKYGDHAFFVMQDVNHQLFTESVLEEVLLSLPDDGETEDERQDKARSILEKLDLLDFQEAHPMALSGGQKQRVAIASAIASDRETIVFDEPTSGLDLRHMIQVADLLRGLREEGRSVLVITHDPELILQCSTHVAHFEAGTLENVYELDKLGKERMLRFFTQVFEMPDTPERDTEPLPHAQVS